MEIRGGVSCGLAAELVNIRCNCKKEIEDAPSIVVGDVGTVRYAIWVAAAGFSIRPCSSSAIKVLPASP